MHRRGKLNDQDRTTSEYGQRERRNIRGCLKLFMRDGPQRRKREKRETTKFNSGFEENSARRWKVTRGGERRGGSIRGRQTGGRKKNAFKKEKSE